MESWQKEQIAFLKVQQRAVELGAIMSKPLAEGARYDAIIDWNSRLYRAQIKYRDGHVGNGAINVDLRKRRPRGDIVYTPSEIDVLLVYLPSIDKICWFGPEVWAHKQAFYIRISPVGNKQQAKVRNASDFVW